MCFDARPRKAAEGTIYAEICSESYLVLGYPAWVAVEIAWARAQCADLVFVSLYCMCARSPQLVPCSVRPRATFAGGFALGASRSDGGDHEAIRMSKTFC